MQWTVEHTREVQGYRQSRIPTLEASLQVEGRDYDGRISVLIPPNSRFLGFAAWHLDRDVAAFRSYLSEVVRVCANIVERFDAGDPIDGSYVSMIVYQELLSGLAAGDFEGSMRLASLMGGRSKVEKAEDNKVTLAFGYALKFAVLGEPESEAHKWIDEFAVQCSETRNRSFLGYPHILLAILNNDLNAAQAGFVELLAGHRKQSKGSGFFRGTEDEALSIWGIGLANLCRWRGLDLDLDDPLIPKELLVPVERGIVASLGVPGKEFRGVPGTGVPGTGTGVPGTQY